MHPKCLVLDEATAMLDPAGREEVMSTIKRLNREEGITVVLITHHMEEAVQADEVVVMGSGKVELVGTPREVFTQVEKVTDAGLDVPQVTRLARLLRQRGLSVNNDIMTVEEMVNSLCRLS
jgi:energy-coupling factor transport system ATP-binding protein